jgi:hypothetical protein
MQFVTRQGRADGSPCSVYSFTIRTTYRVVPSPSGDVEEPRNSHCEESGREREGRGNDDEAICERAREERKSRLLLRAPHPSSPLRTPRNDTVRAFSTVPSIGLDHA